MIPVSGPSSDSEPKGTFPEVQTGQRELVTETAPQPQAAGPGMEARFSDTEECRQPIQTKDPGFPPLGRFAPDPHAR